MSQSKLIPFGKPLISAEEQDAVLDVLRGTVLTHGPKCHEFEREFAQFMGGGYCISVSSCTAALHLAYVELGIGSGDEVLVPAQTHTATDHAVEYVGAKPVFVDCELKTGNMDCSKIEPLITARTKAISVVHFLGIPCDMDEILSIAKRHQLKVIEDCALALGARYKKIHVGLWGDAGCFSFYPAKHITTTEGGMFVSKHKSVAERVSRLRAFGVDRSYGERASPGMYDVLVLGYNYRMSELQAAIGCEQLKKVPEILIRRKSNFLKLKSLLSNLEGISIPDSHSDEFASSYYCLSVLLSEPLKEYRDDIIRSLNSEGIGTSIYYPHPVPRLHYYQKKYGYGESNFLNAAAISDRSIALPVGPHISDTDIDYMAGKLSMIFSKMLSKLEGVSR